jgi:hypothetical protein
VGDLLKPEDIPNVNGIDLAFGGDHGKGRFQTAMIFILCFTGDRDFLQRVFVQGEIDSAKDKSVILRKTIM